MQARRRAGEHSERTFTETARRAQIVTAAIEVIADLGYAHASFAQIARHAGLSSTGLISYHFAGKDELLTQVGTEVLDAFASFVRPLVEVETSAAGALRAWFEANIAFMRGHRKPLIALLEIAANARPEITGGMADTREPDIAALEQLLREGQQADEFRQFDARLMAVAIRSVRDGVLRQLAAQPDLDLDDCAHELVTLFDLATRKAQ